jgi:MFS family permease
MVFGELVDCVPVFGSQRRVYILLGALFTASGLVILAGAAGGWLTFIQPDQLYVLGALLIVVGTVIQDVVADAMSTEVVSRVDATGAERPENDVKSELGMVQVLGRLSLSAGIVAVAGLSGVLAGLFGRETVFLLGLVIPLISLRGRSTGAFWAADWPSVPPCLHWRWAAFPIRRKSSSSCRWPSSARCWSL